MKKLILLSLCILTLAINAHARNNVTLNRDGVLVQLSSDPAAAFTCIIPTETSPSDLGTFATQDICLTDSSPREAELAHSAVPTRYWMVSLTSRQPICQRLAIELDESFGHAKFDRALASGCYRIVYQSALLLDNKRGLSKKL